MICFILYVLIVLGSIWFNSAPGVAIKLNKLTMNNDWREEENTMTAKGKVWDRDNVVASLPWIQMMKGTDKCDFGTIVVRLRKQRIVAM